MGDLKYLLPIIREAIYGTRDKLMYKTEAVVGLDEDFMIKAHLMIPEGFENIMYSWMLNFQYINEAYANMYAESRELPEGDIYVFSDPDWSHPDFPYGLTFFDPEHNCAAILGMRYFGEHKKGTLTQQLLTQNTIINIILQFCMTMRSLLMYMINIQLLWNLHILIKQQTIRLDAMTTSIS